MCHVNLFKGLYAQEGNAVVREDARLNYYDYPVALQVVKNLDDAVEALARKFAGLQPVTAIVSHTGGMGDIKACLTPSVRFRFGGEIWEIHDTEFVQDLDAGPEQGKKASAVPRRSDALDAKYRAEQRIREGDFHGAWAVVSHLAIDDSHDPWVRAVHQAANYMEGLESVDPEEFPGLDNELTGELYPVLRAAFRVEAALQSDRAQPLIAEALKALLNFWDVFKLELIHGHLKKNHDFLMDQTTPVQDVPLAFFKTNRSWKECKTRNGNVRINFLNRKAVLELVLRIIDESESTNQSRRHQAVVEFESLIFEAPPNSEKAFNQYRNAATHYVLDGTTLDKVKQLAATQGLWRTDRGQRTPQHLGHCFLETEKVRALFEACHGIDAAAQYRSFVNALFENICAPVFIPASSSSCREP